MLTPNETTVTGAWKNQLSKGSLLAFCCGHVVFLIVSVFPAPPARDDPGNVAADLYRLLLGGRQQWNMFETIPVLSSVNVRLEGEDEIGNRMAAGCVLPDFRPYPIQEDSRYYVLFYRLMLFDNRTAFREAYLRNMAQAISARRRPKPGEKWSLVMDLFFSRTLALCRRDGQLALQVTKTFDIPLPGGNSH